MVGSEEGLSIWEISYGEESARRRGLCRRWSERRILAEK